MNSISSLGNLIISSFRKIPAVNEFLNTTANQSNTWNLLAGILCVVCFAAAFVAIGIGIWKAVWAGNHSEDQGKAKSAKTWAWWGISSGIVLALIPVILMIAGAIMNAVVGSYTDTQSLQIIVNQFWCSK